MVADENESQNKAFKIANNVDPDEMLHIAASHLGLHCLLLSRLLT